MGKFLIQGDVAPKATVGIKNFQQLTFRGDGLFALPSVG